jgi:hypothetical protein
MKKRPKFLIVLISAAITFGALAAIVGKPNYLKHCKFEQCEHHQVEKEN